jgi:two-component system OmpR family response regulator
MSSMVSLSDMETQDLGTQVRRDRVLVVDDDVEIRELLQDYLQRNGYDARAVADGTAMLDALA